MVVVEEAEDEDEDEDEDEREQADVQKGERIRLCRHALVAVADSAAALRAAPCSVLNILVYGKCRYSLRSVFGYIGSWFVVWVRSKQFMK